MADKSKIEWTEATWNPITGCAIVSAGCRNCYAMRLAGTRLEHHPSRAGLTTMTKRGPVWTGEVRFNEAWIDQPLRWRRPRMVFVCAHGDLFAEGVPDEWIDRIFAVMALAPQHTFQILTKRPERMRAYMTRRHPNGHHQAMDYAALMAATGRWNTRTLDLRTWPLPNVWMGVSVEDQATADARISLLLDTPAAIRWISAEPLLGPIDFYKTSAAMPFDGHPWRNGPILQGIHGLVCGGESGPNARPMHPDWTRALRDQCAAAGVAFFFKQWGAWGPDDGIRPDGRDPIMEGRARAAWYDGSAWRFAANGYAIDLDEAKGRGEWMYRVGKKAAGRTLDGMTHDALPEARP